MNWFIRSYSSLHTIGAIITLLLQTRKLSRNVTQLKVEEPGFNLGNVVPEFEPLAPTLYGLCPEAEEEIPLEAEEAPEYLKLSVHGQR